MRRDVSVVSLSSFQFVFQYFLVSFLEPSTAIVSAIFCGELRRRPLCCFLSWTLNSVSSNTSSMSLPNAHLYLIHMFIFTKSLLHVSACYIKHIQGESLIPCIQPSFLQSCLYVTMVVLKDTKYWGAGKSLARPTSRCILFDGENISFDASLVIYIYIYINSTNIPPVIIINRIYEHKNILSL